MPGDRKEKFKGLVSKLELSSTGSLSLNGLPMVLMPRHFFRYILREVHNAVSAETFRKIYWQAGYDGAVSFCQEFQKSHSCTPEQAVRGYLEEMSIRGWGRFSIQSIDPQKGTMEVLLQNSALLAEGDIPSGNLAWEGAMVGSMAYLQAKLFGAFDPGLHAHGREVAGTDAAQRDFEISVSLTPSSKG
jgi:hypothetical protein